MRWVPKLNFGAETGFLLCCSLVLIVSIIDTQAGDNRLATVLFKSEASWLVAVGSVLFLGLYFLPSATPLAFALVIFLGYLADKLWFTLWYTLTIIGTETSGIGTLSAVLAVYTTFYWLSWYLLKQTVKDAWALSLIFVAILTTGLVCAIEQF